MTWSKFVPYPNHPPVQVVLVDDTLRLFQITGSLQSEVLGWQYGTDSFRVNTHVQGDSVTVYFANLEGKHANEFFWDDSKQKIIEKPLDYDFAGQTELIEAVLFWKNDYSEAITLITDFLSLSPEEPRRLSYCGEEGCFFSPLWYHPYLRYLLGLAYELNNQPEEAKLAYFRLWRDYPDHFFSIMAASKLEIIKP